MKTSIIRTTILWLATALLSVANASPTIDTLNVQAYMKKANGTAVTDGTYNLVIGVFQNGTAIWAKQYSTSIANGLFSKSLSGLGDNLSALGAGTGMNSDFSAVTLNPALLDASAAGAVSIRIYASSTIDGTNPQFDISVASVPTSFYANTAKSVETFSIGTAALAVSSRAYTSAGAGDAGKLALLDGTGKFDSTFIPNLSTSIINTGVLGIAYGGTNNGSLGVTAGGAVYADGSKLMTTAAGNSGETLISAGAGAPAWGVLGIAGGGTNNGSLGVTNGGVLYTDGSKAMNTGAGSSGQVLMSNGAAAPTWGTLAVDAGGTGLTSGTSGGVPYYSAGGTMASSAALSANSLVLGGGAGAAPSTPVAVGTAGNVLISAGAGSNPAFGAIDLTDTDSITGALPVANGGTNLSSYTTGDVTYASGATTLSKLSIGTAGQVLTVNSGATAPSWSAPPIGSRSMVYLWEDFFAGPLPTITAAASNLIGRVMLHNGAMTAGSVAVPATSNYHQGVYRVNFGTAANRNGIVGFMPGATGTASCNTSFASTDTWTFEASIAPQTSIAAGAGSTWIGLIAAVPAALTTLSGAQGAAFEVLSAAPTSIASFAKGSGAAASGTADNTSWALNTYVNYKITYDGTTLRMYINNTQVNSTSTATQIPTGTYLCAGVFRRTNGTAAAIDFDYMGLKMTSSNGNGQR